MNYVVHLFVIIFLYFSTFLNAQTDVITNLNVPFGLRFNGNDLYVSEQGRVFRIDISSETPVIEDIITTNNDTNFLIDVVIAGNDLYVTNFSRDTIHRANISRTPVTVSNFIKVEDPYAMALMGNELFISDRSANRVVKTDVTASTPTLTVVATGFSRPSYLAIKDNELYIAEFDNDRVSKLDITAAVPTTATVVATEIDGANGLVFDGNDLYISSFSGGNVFKIDVTGNSQTATQVITNLNTPNALAIKDGELYIAEEAGNKISKVNLSTLSSDSFQLETNNIEIHPNPPTSKTILVKGLSGDNDYKIYSLSGKEVISGKLSGEGEINIESLDASIYFLNIDQYSAKILIN